MIVGIELVKQKAGKIPYPWTETIAAKVCMKAREHGLFIRPVGDVVVFMPPLVSTVAEIITMLDIIYLSIDEITVKGQTVASGGGAHF